MTATESETAAPERLDLASLDVAAERIARLREDFPEVFREDQIDFEALQRSLGAWVDPGKERFGLSWPGKANCMRVVQQPSVGTLVPDRAESVDFDTTGNVIIEGENLEVLKLLQKSYYGKVKMIYIDPPYNTGSQFIYPDNFRDPLQDYLRYSGQVDGNGSRVSTNTETEGRYHSRWLNMMYPRLYLARNLLRDDGLIFVSIDDHEVHNLRAILNEIFGEENLVAQLARVAKRSSNAGTHFSPSKDYIVCYGRSLTHLEGFSVPLTDAQVASFNKLDERGRYKEIGLYQAALKHGGSRYKIECPDGSFVITPKPDVPWRWNQQTFERGKADGLVVFKETERSPLIDPDTGEPSKWNIYTKLYLDKRLDEGMVPKDFIEDVQNTLATREVTELGLDYDFPKPVRLVQYLIGLQPAGADDIILDFFAGSGTTGHAVMKANASDGGERRFILVQLPEPTQGDFATISSLTRERVRRAGQALAADLAGKLDLDGHGPLDLGFRAYRLTESNFLPWNGEASEEATVAQQIELFAENLIPDRTGADILTEILLKAGYELTVPVERLHLAGQEVFSIADGALLVCLERPLTIDVIEAMAARDPAQIVCLDAGFAGDDGLKVNAVQTVKATGKTTFKVV